MIFITFLMSFLLLDCKVVFPFPSHSPAVRCCWDQGTRY